MLARKITPAQHHGIETGAVRNKIVANFFDVRMIHNFNPALPQYRTIRRNIGEVVRHKRNAMPEPAKDIKNIKHPHRS